MFNSFSKYDHFENNPIHEVQRLGSDRIAPIPIFYPKSGSGSRRDLADDFIYSQQTVMKKSFEMRKHLITIHKRRTTRKLYYTW